ncbi:MAG TPA: efflux RND transporter periplasmic adaptor subunit [Planctomycetota bacterium]|nr:efflux RND transporter periplasmic adaptor subunit [Planctomycetota bacterium]HRR83134.1 efflux RND transporter periplasmic adaptor subunit [Planctomycetota bacterium]
MKSAMKALKLLAWLAVVGGLGYWAAVRGYARYQEKMGQAKAPADKGPSGPVHTTGVKARARDLRRVAMLTGTVKPMAEVRVMSKVSGRLDALRLPDGTPIELGTVIERKDTPIAVIDHDAYVAQEKQAEATVKALEAELVRVNAKARPEELAIAEANVKAAQAALESARAAVEGARAAVAQALAMLRNATSEVERIRRLFEEKVATQQQLDSAEAQFAVARERHQAEQQQVRSAEQRVLSAEQQLRAAQEQLALTEKGARQEDREAVAAKIEPARAALELARINVKESTIRAPIAGVVAAKHLDEGNMVSPVTPIVTLMDVATVKVVVGVAERDLTFVRAGATKATVTVDAYGGETFEGTVQKVSPVVDERTRTVEIEVHIANADRRLKPGMFTRVGLLLEERKGATTIPDYAMLWEDEKPFAVVAEGGKAHRRALKLGLAEGAMVEVLEGVRPGETVLTRGHHGLEDGAPVTVEEEAK